MANLNGFDAATVDPATDFEPLPAGKYLAVITDSEMKPTKAGTGHYLQMTFQVIDGPFKNRLLWSRLNLDNPNRQAVQIAQGELSAICRAVSTFTTCTPAGGGTEAGPVTKTTSAPKAASAAAIAVPWAPEERLAI